MHLTVKINDELFVLARLLGNLLQEDLLEIDRLRGDDCNMSIQLLVTREVRLIVPERFLLGINFSMADIALSATPETISSSRETFHSIISLDVDIFIHLLI